MTRFRNFRFTADLARAAICALVLLPGSPLVAEQQDDHTTRSLLIVVDGLRPDYITPELTPNLHALGERGVVGERHTAVYPTYTRVNSASIGTGSYPRTHGLMHNRMYHPKIGSFNTTDVEELRRLDDVTGGNLITTISLGEVLEENELHLLAVGTGGLGNTFLQNPRGSGKGIWQVAGLFVPEEAMAEAVEALGELPGSRGPAGTAWAIDAYLYHALGDTPPDVTILWIGEPDRAGHRHGVGAPETLEAISHVDEQIGRLLEAHDEHGLTEKVNVFVTSDHGFSTTTREFRPGATLEAAGLTDGVRVVSNQIFLEGDDPEDFFRAVEALQRDEAIGNIYTRPVRPGASEGIAPGTLSTAAIEWDHKRAADIVVSPAWTDDVNEFGYAGTTSLTAQVATHGSDSPFDLQIHLIAAGPDLKSGLRSSVPTGNVDFAPTMLHLLGIEPPKSMDGRIVRELLKDGPQPEDVPVHEQTHRAASAFADGFRYEAELEVLRVDTTSYPRAARTRRD